jgi:cobalt-zinc-cadmium resistance protein CzcA
MLERIILWSLNHRLVVVLLTAASALLGARALTRLNLDAFPDTSPVQVQVHTFAPHLTPEEMEQQVTLPLERGLGGLPGLELMRSITRTGLCQVSLIFAEKTDLFRARQSVAERLQRVVLPAGVKVPELGPMTTGLGEIFHYELRSDHLDLLTLTELQEWVLRPELLAVQGVAELSTWGGARKEFQVMVDSLRLQAGQLTLADLRLALENHNISVSGGSLASAGEQFLIQGNALLKDLEDLGSIPLRQADGATLRLGEVAELRIDHGIRLGAATSNGQGEMVLGLAFMARGENARAVSRRLANKLDQLRASLPEGVTLRVLYRRDNLVDSVLATVKTNLFEGALLVIAVLFAFLGNLRAGLIVASAIPLSLLFAAQGMLQLGIAGSLMSLGAIDFGLVVDSSVVMVENAMRRLSSDEGRRPPRVVVAQAALEVRRPTLFGELIIMVVYLPVLALEGVEGKLFQPMALTVMLALTASLLLSLTFVPVLISLLLPRARPWRWASLFGRLETAYGHLVLVAIRRRRLVLSCCLMALVAGTGLAFRLGGEFIPRLSEMGVVINAVRLSGVALPESIRQGSALESWILQKFPNEVAHVWTRTGTADVATDPMGVETSDLFLELTPRGNWRKAKNQQELMAALRSELSTMPGMRLAFSQPIELRMNEMFTGIRADLAVIIYADGLEDLERLADEAATLVRRMPGATDVAVEQLTGQRALQLQLDPLAPGRYGLSSREILELVSCYGHPKLGEIRQGSRRFDLVLAMDPASRTLEDFAKLMVPLPEGGAVPLAELGQISLVEVPAALAHENMRRRIAVSCNVVGRDLAGFVAQAKKTLESSLRLPEGATLAFGGTFEHMARAQSALLLVVPLTLLLVFCLLYLSTNSLLDASIIFSGAPFAALGGVAALALRDMPLSVSAAVGFIALSGVSMLNGLVLISTFRRNLQEGCSRLDAIQGAAATRLRPVIMTALVAGLGFLPMAFNTGIGAEVQRPLATVVVAGVFSDTLLTLLMLPIFLSLPASTEGDKRVLERPSA